MTEYYNFIYSNFTVTNTTINIEDLDLSVQGKQIFKNTNIKMSPGNIYGLIGSNGSGKSTLLINLLKLKKGNNIKILNRNIDVLLVEQILNLSDDNPVDVVLHSNYKLNILNAQMKEFEEKFEEPGAESKDNFNELYEKYEELSNIVCDWDEDMEKVKIIKILTGLGFSSSDLKKSSNLFSGGWQMRISLARALYLEPDLLLLDEPTNHLDLEAIIWLTEYINNNVKSTIIVVSHNIGFLNDICDSIYNIENNQLVKYKGNYSQFKNTYDGKLKEEEKKYRTYEQKLKLLKKENNKNKIKDFIKNNEVKRPSKIFDGKITFMPYANTSIFGNLISVNNVDFYYDDYNYILKNINFGMDIDSRIVLVGPNGCGKSTLIKLLTKTIYPTEGYINYHSQLRIGYYNQHSELQLPVELTPIEYLKSIVPKIFIEKDVEYTVRKYLGITRLEPSAHMKKIGELSGGQKARVNLVQLIFSRPNCLLLDEPTNHLDIDTVNALIDGLCNFKGAILVITHDYNLIEKINANVVMLDKNTHNINTNINSYDKYSEYILNEYLK